ncbi:MAG: endonuclease/exonuclease/phosphatase family protein [Labilithrix sp.]|nr:endonuclease/exonuclease/phosphatase family protein [Labilithrix sp.]
MTVLRVTTWNVLHHVHALNWKEKAVERFSDERARVAGISALVARWLADEGSVVCLQEVSGDQLASLREAARGMHVSEHRYPRLPRLRVSAEAQLDDPTEHLVTITSLPAKTLYAKTFESDPGKGFLAVAIEPARSARSGAVLVINTHVSAKERREAELALLGATAREATGGAILTGDFNAPVDVVRRGLGLGDGLVASDLTGERPTRVATETHAGKTIDHVLTLGGAISAAAVLDGEGLSDHDPVAASVTFGA